MFESWVCLLCVCVCNHYKYILFATFFLKKSSGRYPWETHESIAVPLLFFLCSILFCSAHFLHTLTQSFRIYSTPPHDNDDSARHVALYCEWCGDTHSVSATAKFILMLVFASWTSYTFDICHSDNSPYINKLDSSWWNYTSY